MSRNTGHPEDFSPYLDGDTDDPRYRELSNHLSACSVCAEEVRAWQAMEADFRSPELEVEVPPFQWQRIQAHLTLKQTETGWRHWLAALWGSRRLALNSALTVVLVFGIMVSGLEYRKYKDDKQLTALASYAHAEEARLRSAGNPFSNLIGSPSVDNPFAQFQNSGQENPFVNR